MIFTRNGLYLSARYTWSIIPHVFYVWQFGALLDLFALWRVFARSKRKTLLLELPKKRASMKHILTLIKWMWCADCMTRQDFERTPSGWKCTHCGQVVK